jgi:hypothetical protein
MIMMTRRTFLRATALCSAGLALSVKAKGFAGDADLTIAPRLSAAGPVKVPANFMGLGYEMSSVATPGLLSNRNSKYLELVRGLGGAGVVRVGGIVADYSRFVADGKARAEPKDTVVTSARLASFGKFLDAVGWSALWSVNFAQGSMAEAITETRAVTKALGPRLLAIELGNEVENFGQGPKPFRTPPYTYEEYRREFDAWRVAIVSAVPGTRFAAPDTASSVNWVERMARDAKGKVQLLTTHYYRGGQRQGTAEELLHPDPKLMDELRGLRLASQQSGIPWRMCEMNSFYGGGRPGVSDTIVGALWTLDSMLLLAEYGCGGVNMETGVNQLGFESSYSPIRDTGTATAGRPYYGMLAFAAAFAHGPEVLPMEVGAEGANVTAYALGHNGKPRCAVVVNKERAKDVRVSLRRLGMREFSAMRLEAASPGSNAEVTLGGALVDAEGKWTPKHKERVRDGVVRVGPMSAAVLESI